MPLSHSNQIEWERIGISNLAGLKTNLNLTDSSQPVGRRWIRIHPSSDRKLDGVTA